MPRLSEPPPPPTVKGTGGKTLNAVTPQSPHATSLRTIPLPPPPHCQRDWRKDIKCSDPPESSCHVSQTPPPPPQPPLSSTPLPQGRAQPHLQNGTKENKPTHEQTHKQRSRNTSRHARKRVNDKSNINR